MLKLGEHLSGYIAVAPAGVAEHAAAEYAAVSVATLVLYGANDAVGAEAGKVLAGIPGAEIHAIPAAGHACYLDDPSTFNHLLLAFLDAREARAAQ